MTSRGRNYSQTNEWDSSRDDYNSYDNQYLDDEDSDTMLDHCRLYIRNVPKGLNEEGLRAAFAKFGTLVQVFLSKDPQKNYALVKYETPGEAKLAMMKMNHTEPLRLQINISQKRKKPDNNRDSNNRINRDRNANSGRERDRSDRMSTSNRDREESGSVVSRGKNSRLQDEIPNGGNNMDEMLMDDEYGFSDILDPNLHLELENLKLEQLKVREEQLQVKQRVIFLKQAGGRPLTQMSNRCILPDGKIVVRNVNDRESRDADVSFSAGAGDSLKLPGLQRVAVRQCVVCGSGADAFCAGCGITPYCSERCQRRDWQDRHMAVCHNLARMNSDTARGTREFSENEPRVQPAMPLRRPHTNTPNNKRDQDKDDFGAATTSRASVKSPESNGKEDRYNKSQEKSRQPFKPRNLNQEKHDEPIISAKPVAPQNEDSFNKGRTNQFNRTRQQPAAKNTEVIQAAPPKTEPVVPAAIPKQNLVPKTSPASPISKPEAVTPKENIPPSKESTPAVTKPASVSDVTPTTRKIVPKNYLLEKLSVGDSVMMSVETAASQCRISRGDFVCLCMAEAFEADYQLLCEDFVLDCDKDEQPYKPTPGEACSYFNPEDGGWYRARCLNATSLALFDSSKIVSITPSDKIRRLANKYEAVPEFCAVLASKAVEVGANLNCKILSQTPNGYKISMTNLDTNANIGEAEVFRWLPTVEYQAASAAIPEVERPPLTDGAKVLLVLANSLDKVFVRPADGESQRKYNDVLQQVLLTAMKAKPLKEPPQKGQMVLGKFTDGNHYRALVKRTNIKQNKYQIEYVEYGNIEVSTLENLYPCPSEVDLSSIPSLVSMLKLAPATELSTAAAEFVEELKNEEELLLTLPNGAKSAPSGSEATLTIVKNKVNLGKKLVEMCTPEWKKIEERGGDVVETEHIMYNKDIEFTTLPPNGCTIEVLDISVLQGGVLSGYDQADQKADLVFNQLTQKLEDYCNSDIGKEPYLPKAEELCLAQLPPYPQWFRAVLLELISGPGSSEAKICYIDYGNLATVPVTLLRKMMPEFIHGIPVMGLHLEIKDFPKDASDEMLARAIIHMNVDEEGRGSLKVTKCVKQSYGIYLVEAPELIKAMKG